MPCTYSIGAYQTNECDLRKYLRFYWHDFLKCSPAVRSFPYSVSSSPVALTFILRRFPLSLISIHIFRTMLTARWGSSDRFHAPCDPENLLLFSGIVPRVTTSTPVGIIVRISSGWQSCTSWIRYYGTRVTGARGIKVYILRYVTVLTLLFRTNYIYRSFMKKKSKTFVDYRYASLQQLDNKY